MILVNDKQVEFTKFPDGTTSFRFSPHLPPRMFAQPMEPPIFSITWKYDNDEECILLWYLTNHIRENNQRPIIRLSLPYIPKMCIRDRVMYGLHSYYRMVEKETIDAIVAYINKKMNVDVIRMMKDDLR